MSEELNLFKLNPTNTSNHNRTRYPMVKIDVGHFVKRIKQTTSASCMTRFNEIKVLKTLFNLSEQNLQSETVKSIQIQDENQGKQIIKDQILLDQGLIYAAEPQSNKCMVCRQEFQCYFEHINNPKHKKNQRKPIMIGDKNKISLNQSLSNLVQSINNFSIKQVKSVRINHKRQQAFSSSSDEIDIIHTPRKYRIMNNCSPIYMQSTQAESLFKSAGLPRIRNFTDNKQKKYDYVVQ